MKRLVAILVCALFCTAGIAPVWAGASSKALDAGNAVCPVSGDKVSGKDFVTTKGLRYGMCCGMCSKDFNKDPEKYLASLKPLAPGMASSEHPGEGAHDHAGHEHPGKPA